MKKILASLALTLISHASLADGFMPWGTRAAPHAAATPPAMTAPAGFAPWRDRMPLADKAAPGVRLGAGATSAFRPWS